MKREKDKEKKRKKIKLNNLIGCGLILLLFAVAFFLPPLYFSYLDKKNEGELAYIDAELAAYELQYESMLEKLQTLGECEIAEWEMQATLLQETTDSEKRSHLTERVNEELQIFGIEYFGYNLQCTLEEMESCELYTLYPVEEIEKGFQGISFWQLRYKKNTSEIRILLDTEFEKIYAVSIKEMEDFENAEEREGVNVEVSGVNEVMEVMTKNSEEFLEVESYALEDEWSYFYLDLMLKYYDLDESEEINPYIDWSYETEKRMQMLEDYFEGYSNYVVIGTGYISFHGAEYRELGLCACIGNENTGGTEYVMGLAMMFEYLQL